MSGSFAVLLIFAMAVLVAMLTNKLKISYTVALVCVGLGFSVMQNRFFPDFDIGIHLTQELLFHVLLPILIFEASYHLNFRSFMDNLKWIFHFAITGLAAGMMMCMLLIVGICQLFDIDFPWSGALVISAIVAATDPVGVISALRATRAPHRLTVVMEGESLLNDGIAVVVTTVVFIYLGFDEHATISAPWLAQFLGLEVAVSFIIGGGVGFGVCWLLARIDDHLIEIALTTTCAFGSFLLAEEMHSSGVLSCLTAGMIVGNYGAKNCMNASTKMAVVSFWEYTVFAANSMVFLLIGLEIELDSLISNALPIVITWVAMLIARFVFVWAIEWLVPGLPRGYSPVIVWGGVRGGIAMVLALTVPASYEYRGLVLDCIFGASLLTILIQSTTIKPLLKKYGLISENTHADIIETVRGRVRSLHSARNYLERQKDLGVISPAVYNKFNKQLCAEAQAINQMRLNNESITRQIIMEEARILQRHLLQVRKEDLSKAASDGAIDPDVGRLLVGQLDEQLLELDNH